MGRFPGRAEGRVALGRDEGLEVPGRLDGLLAVGRELGRWGFRVVGLDVGRDAELGRPRFILGGRVGFFGARPMLGDRPRFGDLPRLGDRLMDRPALLRPPARPRFGVLALEDTFGFLRADPPRLPPRCWASSDSAQKNITKMIATNNRIHILSPFLENIFWLKPNCLSLIIFLGSLWSFVSLIFVANTRHGRLTDQRNFDIRLPFIAHVPVERLPNNSVFINLLVVIG